MALANRQLLEFIGRRPDDPLVAMLAEVHVNASFDYPAAESGDAGLLATALPLPMLCELFTDCFAEFTLPAGADSLAGALVADWPSDLTSRTRGREPTS